MRFLEIALCLATVIVCASAFRCYICNSDMQSDCKDNFDKFLKGCPVKSFSGLKNQKAIGCRKTEQHIGEEYAIIRECAYSGEDVANKINKGSTGISRTIEQCSDKHGCNGATTASFAAFTLITALLVFIR